MVSRVVGIGYRGAVFEAKHEKSNVKVAVKMILYKDINYTLKRVK